MAGLIYLIGIPSLLANGASDFFTNFMYIPGDGRVMDFLSVIGYIANDTFLPLGGFLISVFGAYVWKTENLDKELGTGYPGYQGSIYRKLINFGIAYICPTLLGVIFVFTVLDRFIGIQIFN